MPTFEEARSAILSAVTPLGVERVSLLDALGRIVCADIAAAWDMPQWDNSAMDGFAVRAADCSGSGTALPVIGYIPAGGEVTGPLQPGTAIKIMTGAPIPPGADAVVPVEETEERGETVHLSQPVKKGQHIRFKGEDVPAGSIAIAAGTLVRPAEINMLASFGKIVVPVYRKPRVAILSTGDELVEAGEALTAGKIVNSNIWSLAAAVREAGAEPVMIGIARDNLESHRQMLSEGLRADILITSAGVSAGDRDLVRDVLQELGVNQLFWRVDIKPGGPTAFGLKDGKPVFSLPGNPVSTLVTFDQFVRPALLKMMGHRRVIRPYIPVILDTELRKKPGKVQFIRLRLNRQRDGFHGASAGDQQTGILKTMVTCDALAVLPAEETFFAKGGTVNAQLLTDKADFLEP